MRRFHYKACLPPLLLGYFALTAQMLLLRQFLWRVDATGTGVGVFLATWLGWIGVGALLAQTQVGDCVVQALSRWFPAALWLYLPLAVTQYLLIDHLRGLVVVPEYLTSPIGHMALGALVANAPVSFGTGFLFPAATRWFVARGGSTSLTYALDPAGAVAAGVLVTVFLAAGVRLEGQHTHDWQRLFPGSHPGGSFTTPAATYLYGWPGGTFYIVSSGGVVDTLPEPGQSREIAALLLSQKPDARYVLLLGRVPLAVALALQELQPLASVTWCHDDPVYARTMIRLAGNLPPGTNQAGSAGLSLRRIRVPDVGPQVYVRDAAKGSGYFDVALVWPAALVSPGGAGLLGRVLLQQVRAALQPEGVVALPLGGGPGAWSPEQRRLAAAILMNADAVWPRNGWWCRVLVAGGWQGMHRARCAIRQRRCFILNN